MASFFKIMGLFCMVGLVSFFLPSLAFAVEQKNITSDEVILDINDYVGFNMDEIYYGTRTPHDGIDDYDESFFIEAGQYGNFDSNSYLSGFNVVSYGSSLKISLNPNYKENYKVYARPVVYALDDDGHLAYRADSVKSEGVLLTTKPKTIIHFTNQNPLSNLENANHFVDVSQVKAEKLIFLVEICKIDNDTWNEEMVCFYNFRMAKPTPSVLPSKNMPFATGKIMDVQIGQEKFMLDSYLVDGNNYVKLRDIAKALNGTSKQFNVVLDKKTQYLHLLSKTAYIPVGDELSLNEKGIAFLKNSQPSSTALSSYMSQFTPKSQYTASNAFPIYLDDIDVTIHSYLIGDSAYFKLRDIAKLIGFGLSSQEGSNTVIIDPMKSYQE